jgi:hypothetical protein
LAHRHSAIDEMNGQHLIIIGGTDLQNSV